MAFPDPDRPIATCVAENCTGCPAGAAIHCHFQARDLTHFLLICLPSFLLGGAAIVAVGAVYLIPWIAFCLAYFGLIEIRVMCSHCPHYAEPGRTLRCWANHGSPKLWKYRPGPMSLMEKIVFFGGFALIWGYPPVFFVLAAQWFLLLVYAMSTAGFFMTLKLFFCSQCMNFACPLNSVDDAARQAFFERNPEVAEAWAQT